VAVCSWRGSRGVVQVVIVACAWRRSGRRQRRCAGV